MSLVNDEHSDDYNDEHSDGFNDEHSDNEDHDNEDHDALVASDGFEDIQIFGNHGHNMLMAHMSGGMPHRHTDHHEYESIDMDGQGLREDYFYNDDEEFSDEDLKDGGEYDRDGGEELVADLSELDAQLGNDHEDNEVAPLGDDVFAEFEEVEEYVEKKKRGNAKHVDDDKHADADDDADADDKHADDKHDDDDNDGKDEHGDDDKHESEMSEAIIADEDFDFADDVPSNAIKHTVEPADDEDRAIVDVDVFEVEDLEDSNSSKVRKDLGVDKRDVRPDNLVVNHKAIRGSSRDSSHDPALMTEALREYLLEA